MQTFTKLTVFLCQPLKNGKLNINLWHKLKIDDVLFEKKTPEHMLTNMWLLNIIIILICSLLPQRNIFPGSYDLFNYPQFIVTTKQFGHHVCRRKYAVACQSIPFFFLFNLVWKCMLDIRVTRTYWILGPALWCVVCVFQTFVGCAFWPHR